MREIEWSADLSISMSNYNGEIIADCLDDLTMGQRVGVLYSISCGKTDGDLSEARVKGGWVLDIHCREGGKDVDFEEVPEGVRAQIAEKLGYGECEGVEKLHTKKRSRGRR